MTTLEQVRRWSASGVRDVAASVGGRAVTLGGVAQRLPDEVAGWRGEAADAARSGLDGVRAGVRAEAAEVAAVAEALQAAAGRLDQLVVALRQLEESLRTTGFELTDDGRVVDLQACLPAVDAAWSPAERLGLRTTAEGDVQALLATADDVDHSLARALAGIGAGEVTSSSAVCRPGVATATSVAASAASRDEDLRTRAHQVVGVVSSHTHKRGRGPVSEESRQRYAEDEAFATAADEYSDHGDAGMLARSVLLATGDHELAQWVYTHPYEWAHEAEPFESQDGAPYVMDVPVQHSTLTLWARAATAVSQGYLDGQRPRVVRTPRPDPRAVEVARNRAAHDMFGKVTNRVHVEYGATAQRIARGHSYDKHVLGLDKKGAKVHTPDMPEITSHAELEERIFRTMYTQPRVELAGQRAYHLDRTDQHIVITNERASDGGTSFRVTQEAHEQRMLAQDAAQRAREGLDPTPPPRTAPGDLQQEYVDRNPLPEKPPTTWRTEMTTTLTTLRDGTQPTWTWPWSSEERR